MPDLHLAIRALHDYNKCMRMPVNCCLAGSAWDTVRQFVGNGLCAVPPSPRNMHSTLNGIPSVQTVSHLTRCSGPLGYGRYADGTAHRPFPAQTHMVPFIQVRKIVTGLYPGVPDHTPARCAIVRRDSRQFTCSPGQSGNGYSYYNPFFPIVNSRSP